MWGGRFSGKLDPNVLRFTRSIDVDKKLAEYDLRGSLAHVRMLKKRRIIPAADAVRIEKGLKILLRRVQDGKFVFDRNQEDIHSDVEAKLKKLIGRAAERLPTARSRNDQITLDTRMYCRDALAGLDRRAAALERALLAFAGKNSTVIIPGFTHLQHAQPVLFAHYLLAYVEMLERDRQRFAGALRRTNVCPAGAGALAGTGLPIDREMVAKELGFPEISANSIDAVSDRDFVVEVLLAASLAAMHLSRLAEDLILMASPEFGWLEIDDSFATGSSIMPQKKNPDVLELVRGRTGRIYGNLISVLVTLKGLPLSYDRDLQEDKAPLFDSVETLGGMLEIMEKLFGRVRLNRRLIGKSLEDETMMATDLAEYLVGKDVPFRSAHEAVGKLVRYCLERGRKISELKLSELKSFSDKFSGDACALLDARNSVRIKTSYGGTSPARVNAELKKWKKRLG